MESTLAVANYFVKKGLKSKTPVPPMKLQRLIYFSHGWYWAFMGEPLIDETIEAWEFGPVVPSIFHGFGHYGLDSITSVKKNLFGETPIVEQSETVKLLDSIWRVYSKVSMDKLTNLMLKEGTPWSDTLKFFREKGRVLPKGKDVDDDLIKRYFDAQRATHS